MSNNSVPIFGTFPGYIEGSAASGITVNLIYDYMCSDCLAENPVIEELMKAEFQDGTVSDYIQFTYTSFPLPYHVHAYQVNQLVPFFMDLCIESASTCFNDSYRDFSFANQSTILGMKDTSQNDFIDWWSGQVASEFNLEKSLVLSAYDYASPYSTDSSQRDFLKFAWARGVTGTPFAFVNQVKLDSVPTDVDGWLNVLNSVYNSQYRPTTHRRISYHNMFLD